MPWLEPQFGVRDYLCYLLPGIVALSGFLVWDPSLLETFQNNPLAATLIMLAAGYLAGHICKLFGEIFLKCLRRRIGYNPHQNVFNLKEGRWSDEFKLSLVEKLKAAWGDELIKQEMDKNCSNIILLCWYDSFKTPSKGHDEVDRYVALYNLCMALIPASLVLAILCCIKGLWSICFIALAAMFTFAFYWYRYEMAFCRSIIRIWYTQNSKKS
jgi:hypothetical protein